MKQETIVLLVALVAIGVAAVAVVKASKASGMTIIQAPRRTDAESILSGISQVIDKAGEAAGDVITAWRPAVGPSPSQSGS